MKRSQIYIINGPPIPWARAGLNRSTGTIYDTQLGEKFDYQLQLKQQQDINGFFKGPIHIDVTFFMAIPKSWSAKKADENRGKPHAKKPDFSNLLKFIEDAATGILYIDDCLIYAVTGRKIYDDCPRTEITLREI